MDNLSQQVSHLSFVIFWLLLKYFAYEPICLKYEIICLSKLYALKIEISWCNLLICVDLFNSKIMLELFIILNIVGSSRQTR